MRSENLENWNQYVSSHPQAGVYHRAEWLRIIEESYGHKPYFLVAYRDNLSESLTPDWCQDTSGGRKVELRVEVLNDTSRIDNRPLAGVLPVVEIKSRIFGSSLTSIPFFDAAGVLADDPECEQMLVQEATRIVAQSKLNRLDLRHAEPLNWLEGAIGSASFHEMGSARVSVSVNKARMVLELPDSSEDLMKSFKSKLRNQINKPLKEGLTYSCGGLELLDEFYGVFVTNMRDLGSPVHSKRLFESVLGNRPGQSWIFIVRKDRRPLAASIALGFKGTFSNPWASSLRKYGALNPNMLLYWAMLKYACDNGFKFFDFGRSTPGEGTYRFKEQWGAKQKTLRWYTITAKEEQGRQEKLEQRRMTEAVELWKRLPVALTRIIGPVIRKYISL
jgi:serine/alanine adding enzyme